MEEAGSANALAINYQSAWSHIPEDLNLHQHHCENLKSQNRTLSLASSSQYGKRTHFEDSVVLIQRIRTENTQMSSFNYCLMAMMILTDQDKPPQ